MDSIWQKTLADLQLQMTRATFDTWLRGSQVVSQENSTLTVWVPHAYAVDWLQDRLKTMVDRTVERHAGQPLTVVFTNKRPPGEPLARPDPDPEKGEPANEVIFEAVQERHVTHQDDGLALSWTDFYIKLKVAFRRKALLKLKGAKLSVFLCLALHVDRDGVAAPGVDAIMRETGYSRSVVCNALEELASLGIIAKRTTYRGNDEYVIRGYAWFGTSPAPSLWEVDKK